MLGTADLVSVRQHRRALAQYQGCEDVAHLPGAQRENLRIIGGPFHTAVPGPVVGFAVLIVLAVGLVVFLVVGDQVSQGEPVVSGDEVDTSAGAAPGGLVQVR
ncbi:Uncharacterised protein [Mycobacteroides abscessus subsp. abscessus]|nr:Uncharacterised protein [Mycobacteroides abscessus subsp. abscessus]